MFKKVSLLTMGIVFAGFAYCSAQNFESKAQVFANEVYQDCPQYAAPDQVVFIKEMLGRMTVVTEPSSAQESYTKLSALVLKNKCNFTLTRDEQSFNPATFNPLKYFFNFYPNSITKYRVDGTNYVIVISPQP